MKLKTKIILTLALITLITLTLPYAVSMAETKGPKVVVKVDGLTCPFCAYGMEKRLKKLESVKEYKVEHDKGLVELYQKPNRVIDLDEVHSAIEGSGFSPREFSVEVEGKLSERNGQTVLIASGEKSEEIYLLKPADQVAKLKSMLKGEKAKAFVSGKAQKEALKGHKSHPYTITIESFGVSNGS